MKFFTGFLFTLILIGCDGRKKLIDEDSYCDRCVEKCYKESGLPLNDIPSCERIRITNDDSKVYGVSESDLQKLTGCIHKRKCLRTPRGFHFKAKNSNKTGEGSDADSDCLTEYQNGIPVARYCPTNNYRTASRKSTDDRSKSIWKRSSPRCLKEYDNDTLLGEYCSNAQSKRHLIRFILGRVKKVFGTPPPAVTPPTRDDPDNPVKCIPNPQESLDGVIAEYCMTTKQLCEKGTRNGKLLYYECKVWDQVFH